jgi:hypothetical protein
MRQSRMCSLVVQRLERRNIGIARFLHYYLSIGRQPETLGNQRVAVRVPCRNNRGDCDTMNPAWSR